MSVRLLGQVSVLREGVSVAIPHGRTEILFAYLVDRRPGPVSRDELLQLLWPERLPRHPEASLRTLLSRLRAVLDVEILGPRPVSMIALPPLRTDVEDLEARVDAADQAWRDGSLARAAAIALEAIDAGRQRFLAAHEGPWVESRRVDLAEERNRMLSIVCRAAAELRGELLSAGRRAGRELVLAQPYGEAACEALMHVEVAAGDPAAAILAYDELRRRLVGEFGVAPSPRLRRLHASLVGNHETRAPSRESRLREAIERSAEWHEAESVEALPPLVVEAVNGILEVDATGWNTLDRESGALRIDTFPDDATFIEDIPLLESLIDEHPLVSLLNERPGPLTWSDARSRREIERTQLYNDFMKPHKIGSQMSIMAGFDPWIALTVNREHGEFTSLQRELVGLLGRHAKAAREALVRKDEAAARLAALEAMAAEMAEAVIVLGTGGSVEAASRPARDLLERWFGGAWGSRLPGELRDLADVRTFERGNAVLRVERVRVGNGVLLLSELPPESASEKPAKRW